MVHSSSQLIPQPPASHHCEDHIGTIVLALSYLSVLAALHGFQPCTIPLHTPQSLFSRDVFLCVSLLSLICDLAVHN